MDEKQCVELLEHHGVKATANRIVVVKALAAADRPMSLSELEYQILTIDKSGVFRALTLFKEHHLVHVIEDGGDGVRYELCHGPIAWKTSKYRQYSCLTVSRCILSTIWSRASAPTAKKEDRIAAEI